MSTYFLVATVEADSEADAIEMTTDDFSPLEALTVEELSKRIGSALIRYAAELRDAADFGTRVDVTKAYEAHLVEIVTLGDVPASA